MAPLLHEVKRHNIFNFSLIDLWVLWTALRRKLPRY